ncbi:MAG: TlpA family protein disulfide reductase [Sulfurovum sp.]|nr:TlpA family protein disulfide reductase [Sulfurovum sp.]
MKAHPTIWLILTVLISLFVSTGCKEKPKEKLPYEHSVESIPATPVSQNLTKANHTPTLYPSGGKRFNLGDQKGIVHSVSVENDQLFFKDISQPVVILNFFSTWSLPCQAEAPYLVDLQKKYPKQIFVMGVLLHPDDHLQELEKFINENQIDYFISSSSENDRFTQKILEKLHMPDILPIPLTVIYHGGHYYRHYEGAVPIEMIEHDIKTILR